MAPMPVWSVPEWLVWVVLFTLAESAIEMFTVRMSPILLARWSPKKERAPVRQSELGPAGSFFGGGSGIDTFSGPATVAGLEIGDSLGLEKPSVMLAQPLASAALRAARPASLIGCDMALS